MSARFSLLLVLFSPLCLAQTPYQEIEVVNGGKITGTVRLGGKMTQTEAMEITKDNDFCGRQKPSPTLVIGKNRGVKDAVVVLEGITKGKKKPVNSRVTLDQVGCDYVPHVLAAVVGTQLEIVNSDAVLHNVHAYNHGGDRRTIFNIAQPIKGQRTAIEQTRLTRKGTLFAVCDAGHPWMSAYVFVSDHPYFSVSDDDGNFTIEDVPEGTYRLKMWHEGVKIINREYERGKVKKYHYEEPYEVVKEVRVATRGSHTVDFELMLR